MSTGQILVKILETVGVDYTFIGHECIPDAYPLPCKILTNGNLEHITNQKKSVVGVHSFIALVYT